MADVHMVVGLSLFALNLIAGIWGVTAWLRKRPSLMFWKVLRVAQTAVVVQAALGGYLLITGHRAVDELHYVYGIVPLVIALVTEGMRIGAAQRAVGDTDYTAIPESEQHALAAQIFIAETRVMAIGALFIAAIAIRAGMSSGAL